MGASISHHTQLDRLTKKNGCCRAETAALESNVFFVFFLCGFESTL